MAVLLARVCGSIATGVVHWATFCVAAPVSAGDGEAELACPAPACGARLCAWMTASVPVTPAMPRTTTAATPASILVRLGRR